MRRSAGSAIIACSGNPNGARPPAFGAQALSTYFVGQGVGLMNKIKPAREVVLEFIEDYLSAAERLCRSIEE
jgi:hypothetical protein